MEGRWNNAICLEDALDSLLLKQMEGYIRVISTVKINIVWEILQNVIWQSWKTVL